MKGEKNQKQKKQKNNEYKICKPEKYAASLPILSSATTFLKFRRRLLNVKNKMVLLAAGKLRYFQILIRSLAYCLKWVHVLTRFSTMLVHRVVTAYSTQFNVHDGRDVNCRLRLPKTSSNASGSISFSSTSCSLELLSLRAATNVWIRSCIRTVTSVSSPAS